MPAKDHAALKVSNPSAITIAQCFVRNMNARMFVNGITLFPALVAPR